MKLKKYVGSTMPEIMQKIRTDLGPDAVILNTKEVQKGGVFGFFTKKKLEVVAALDPEPIQMNSEQVINQPTIDEQPMKQHVEDKNSNESILHEIQQLKEMMKTQVEDNTSIHPEYLFVYEYLKDQEVEEELAIKLIENLNEQIEHSGTELHAQQIMAHSKVLIESLLNQHLTNQPANAQVIHFVGPTGVGKTTTLAKVAANSILQDKKKVAFITTDTYRIAAIDQLKTYAQILNVPLEVAYTQQDYIQALEKFSDYDLIYVDTAGRNFRENDYVKELKEMIELRPHSQTYLVLSLTAKPKDIKDVFNEFKLLHIKDVIFTKIDETRQYGSILNIVLTNAVNVAYLTNGQDVPNDLIIPTANSISDLFLGDYTNE